MLKNFNGNILKRPGKIDLRTQEGSAVVQETLEFIKKVSPLTTPALTWSNELWKACRDHVKDTGPSGITGHTGADGSNVS
jgi:uncharacterized protein YkwD